jgi:hypothetical protein
MEIKQIEDLDRIAIGNEPNTDICKTLIKRKVSFMGNPKYSDVYELMFPKMQCYYCTSYLPYGTAYFCQNKKIGDTALGEQK